MMVTRRAQVDPDLVTTELPNQDALGGVLAGAALISVLTVAARLAGLARWAVFSPTVGATATGTAYTTANTLPNILFEVVAGGGLAVVLVPLLAGPLSRGSRNLANRITSGLLTWTVTVLLGLAGVLAWLAEPLAQALLGEGSSAATGALAAQLIRCFALQIPLYGVGVILSGYLQAGRRFAWPAVVPLLSSGLVIGVYLGFAALARGAQGDPAALSGSAVALLGWGTTGGVAMLTLPLFIPARRAGLGLSWSYRLPPGVARRAAGLAAAGIGALLAQQLAVLVALTLANLRGGGGAWPVYQYAQAIYLLPYAILAVPVATAAFAHLAASAVPTSRSQKLRFAQATAITTRAVLTVSIAGAAALIAAAPCLEPFFACLDRSGQVTGLTSAVTWFAAGLVGLALIAHLSRVLYAAARPRAAVASTAAGWLATALTSVIAVLLATNQGPNQSATLRGLAIGSCLGMTLAGVTLLIQVRSAIGRQALTGLVKTTLLTGCAATAGAIAGRLICTNIIGPSQSGLIRPLLAGGAATLGVLALVGVTTALADRNWLDQLRAGQP